MTKSELIESMRKMIALANVGGNRKAYRFNLTPQDHSLLCDGEGGDAFFEDIVCFDGKGKTELIKQMTYDDMLHKMPNAHYESLRSMLAVNEVPEPVMAKYFLYKKYLDKVSAQIKTLDLLRIAMDCGFDLDTGKFRAGLTGVSQSPTLNAMKEAMKTLGEEALDEIIEDPNPAPTSVINAEDFVESRKDVDPNADTAMEHEQRKEGDEVSFWFDGKLVHGSIKNPLPEPDEKDATYKVEADGENFEITEDEFE